MRPGASRTSRRTSARTGRTSSAAPRRRRRRRPRPRPSSRRRRSRRAARRRPRRRSNVPTTAIQRPAADEYSTPFARYVERVPDGALVPQLERQAADTAAVLGALSEQRAAFRYAPDKWSVKEIVGHLADAERVFSYRLLRFARQDETALPGFDENAYVEAAGFDRRTLGDLLAELAAVRDATLRLLRGLPADA